MTIDVRREDDGDFLALLEGTELEGRGETATDALRELAETIDFEATR